jgi:hypothetical protein
VSEFIEECRREWRRLGVPDPIANEMAADLAADIEEAESEGGSAEDVHGTSAFDPRRFAGSWAMARGVTSPSVVAPSTPASPRRWPALAFGLLGCTALLALAVAVISGGRQSAAAIGSPMRRFVGGPPIHVFPGGQFVVQRIQHGQGLALFAVLLLALSVIGIVLTVVYWSRWTGGRIGPLEIHRHRAGSGVPRT